jgi:acetylglutamate kinase
VKSNIENRDVVVAALKHAAPYIRMYKGKTFVIKAGGELFGNAARARAFVEQVAILHQVGIRIVLVHGAGPQSTQRASESGLTTNMVNGRRVTDADMIKISAEVSRQVNTQIQSIVTDLGLSAVGMIGADNQLVLAKRRSEVEVEGVGLVDYGFVGDIESVNSNAIQAALEKGQLPVVSAISADASGTVLNINADTVAAALASALNAEKLILATGAAGILESVTDPRSLVSYLDINGLTRMKAEGSLADGMLPKAQAIEDAITGGVPRVHVISFFLADSLLLEIFTNEGTGTLIVKSIEVLTEAEQATGQ